MNRIDESSFRGFDKLPESANVRLPVVAALFGISPATVWRWVHGGLLPAPRKIGGVTFFNVGQLRLILKVGGEEPRQVSS
jgi:predicted site-specific integrase-resolvase